MADAASDDRVANGAAGAVGGPVEALSVSIVCCNNADVIERTAATAASLAAEVVAVDSGSTDATIEILQAHGVRVVHHDWPGFVKQKQFALDLCTRPWVLHLDSDESVTIELAASVRRAVSADPEARGALGGYEVNRRMWWAGRELKHSWQPEWRLRLVQRERAQWGGYDPHDALELTAEGLRVARLTGDLRHDAIADLPTFFARQVSHARVGARSYRAMGRRTSPAKLVTSPVGAFAKMLVLKGGWRDGWRGWCAATTAATGAAMKHAVLLEMQERGEPERVPDRHER